MNVKELISKLEQVENKDLQVVIKHIDDTDWEYNLPLRDKDIFVKKVKEIDEEFEGIIKRGDKCLIINFSFE
jgi:hypothetical protein